MKEASKEELENIRRRAERGRDFAHEQLNSSLVDEFQGIIDLVENIKELEK